MAYRLIRGFCSAAGSVRAERLRRHVVLVRGPESAAFLQGLITNDMTHLTRGNASIYTVFLNKGGRVLYDSLIYKTTTGDDSFLVECDSDVSDQLVRHLKVFRVRRKIEIETQNEKSVWAVFNGATVKVPKKVGEDVICTDPRLKHLGMRLILDAQKDVGYISETFGQTIESGTADSFREHRYKLGVGEGSVDFPREKAFPLEGNVDFLNGVSFHKGCYVGQELTARTHHTGVIRKRLMPIKFNETLESPPAPDTTILNEHGQNIGKLRGYCNGFGLALLRIEPALAAKRCLVEHHEITPFKPSWWPTADPHTLKHVR